MIQIRNLSKKFGDFCAVDNVSFDVGAHEIFGFIGPNGAGKTTTIRMLVTLVEPDHGTAWVDGHCIRRYPEKVRRVLGYMPDYYGVYEEVSIEEYLNFFALAYRIPFRKRRQIIGDCMALTDLSKIGEKLVSSLSKGMKQRLCLAKTLLHDPKILILDEPAAGLDPRARIEFRSLLKELRSMGKTILLSSHILTELADVVDSLVIIERGKVIVSGTPDSISRALSSHVEIKIEIFQGKKLAEAAEILERYEKISHVTKEQNSISLQYSGEEAELYLILRPLIDAQVPITKFSSVAQNLEDIFMQVTKGEIA